MTTATQTEPQFVQFGGEQAESPEKIARTIAELERQKHEKRDFIVPASSLRLHNKTILTREKDEDGDAIIESTVGFAVTTKGEGIFENTILFQPLTDHAHMQIAERMGIPRDYYRRMLVEAPTLLTHNVNRWLIDKANDKKVYLLRGLDGWFRGFLSNRYKVMDSYDLLFACKPVLDEANAKITRLVLTPERFHLRALIADWRERLEVQGRDVKERGQVYQTWLADLAPDEHGNVPYFNRETPEALAVSDEDWIVPGLDITNSEVGLGGLTAKLVAVREICINGTVMDSSISKVHLGAAQSADTFISQETKELNAAAMWSGIQDAVRAAFDRDRFREIIVKMGLAAGEIIEKPVEAVDNVVSEYKMSDEQRQTILNELISGADPTQWGLINAVTSAAQKETNYNDQHHMEEIGGKMLELVRVR